MHTDAADGGDVVFRPGSGPLGPGSVLVGTQVATNVTVGKSTGTLDVEASDWQVLSDLRFDGDVPEYRYKCVFFHCRRECKAVSG